MKNYLSMVLNPSPRITHQQPNSEQTQKSRRPSHCHLSSRGGFLARAAVQESCGLDANLD
ncbi:hypothetical protein EYF80_024568 [Liparis tanakae]|uniref:Uncharacterized protein n=1 Tax=Liparis tanakae TaxID=230148 RepID=A0A4Z2HHT5_9TELE|nr:hypothetical protein EYF80_024568 [Liparis tanakae]